MWCTLANMKCDFIPLLKKLFAYIFTLTYIHISVTLSESSTVEELLSQGTKFLAAGQLNDALTYYSQVIDKEPGNHMGYYRRGTAYLSLGNLRMALADFEKAISLNSGFIPALKQRAGANLKLGKLHEAQVDFGVLASADSEASEKLNLITAMDNNLIEAQKMFDSNRFHDALSLLDTLVESITHSEQLREMRAKCLLEIGEIQMGIKEMRHAVHLINDNRAGLLKLSVLMYDKGMATQALLEISECLRLDQDDKECKKEYSKIKKTAKAIKNAQDAQQASQYQDCIKHAKTLSQLSSNNNEYLMQSDILLCQCHSQGKITDGVKYCERVVQMFPGNTDYQCDLAETHLNADNFDEAIRIYQSVLESDRRNQRAKSGVKKAQKLLSVSKRRDYYKILEVPKSATTKEILKAYRKLAAKWHPDRFDGDDKTEAEKKFVDISAAKEVLSNDEKRKQYDSGIDPLDPSQQQQHQGPFGHPFGGFTFTNMHPFDGANFEFHFG